MELQSTRPLRLWIFNHYATGPDEGGGTRHFELAARMVPMSVETTIFASGFSHFTLRDEKVGRRALWRTELVDGVRFVWVRTAGYRGNGLMRMLSMLSYAVGVQVAQARMPPPDVIIGSTIHPFAALAAERVARRRGARFVYEIRDLWPQTLIDMGALRARGPGARLLRRIERHLVASADAVVTALPGVSGYFDEWGLAARRLAYIPNGVATDHVPARPASAATTTLIGEIGDWRAQGASVFGYVGAHGPANDLWTILEAASMLRDSTSPRCTILLLGDGAEKPALMASASARGLDNVRFADPIPKADVPILLGHLDAGIFHLRPNPVFRFGISSNKLFDYMGAGLPVIFACESGYDPVRRSDGGISIPPGDAASLARAIEDMARMPADQRRQAGERGRDYVSREHDLDGLAGQLRGLVRALAYPP